jgi:hypothetical protein
MASSNAQLGRFVRIGALFLAYLIPIVIGALRFPETFSILAFVYPTPRKAFLALAIGYQIYRIAVPEDRDAPKTAVIEDTNIPQDVSLSMLGLFLLLALYSTSWLGVPDALQPLFYYAVDFLALACIIAFRTRTVIDGEKKKVTRWFFGPRTFDFSQLRGLGLIEVRVMRAGSHVATHYFLGLFPQSGAPMRLRALQSEAELGPVAAELHQKTGIPIASR